MAAFEAVGIEAVVRGADKYKSDIDAIHGKTGSFMDQVKSGFGVGVGIAAFNAATSAVMGLGSSVIGAGFSFLEFKEKAMLTYETLLGGADKAQERVSELSKFAAATPFELPGIIKADQLLQTFGARSMENLTLVGDAAAGVNAPIEEIAFWFGRAATAIQAGKPFGEAAARLQEMGLLSGPARNEMEALAKAGASSEEVMAALSGELGRFGGLMEKQSHTFAGLKSTLSDTFSQVSAGLMAPFFSIMTGGMQNLVNWTSGPAFTNAMEKFSSGVEGGMDRAGSALKGLVSEGGAANIFATKIALALDPSAYGDPSKLGGFTNTIKTIFSALGSHIQEVFRTLKSVFSPVIDSIQNDLIPALGETAGILGGAIIGHVRTLGSAFLVIAQQAGPLVATVLTTIIQVVSRLLPAAAELVALGFQIVDTLIQWAVNSGLVSTAISGLKAIFDVFGPGLVIMAGIIQDIVHWLKEHETVVKILAVTLGILLIALNPIPAAILGIILVIGYLSNHWDDLTGAVSGFIDAVLGIPVLGDVVRAMATVVGGQIEDVIGFFEQVIEVGREIISFFTNVFQGDWEDAWEDIKDIAVGILQLFLDFLQLGFLDDVLEVFSDLPGKVLEALGDLLPFLFQSGIDLLQGLWNGLADLWGRFGPALARLPMLILGSIGRLERTLFIAGIDLLQGLWDGLADLWRGFSSALSRLPSLVVGAIGDVSRTLYQKGIDLMQGFWNGLQTVGWTILDWAGRAGGAIADLISGGFKRAWNTIADSINGLIPNYIGWDTPFGSVGIDVPDTPLPRLSQGAFNIPSTMLALLHPGEMVVPARFADAIRSEISSLSQFSPRLSGSSSVSIENISVHLPGGTMASPAQVAVAAQAGTFDALRSKGLIP